MMLIVVLLVLVLILLFVDIMLRTNRHKKYDGQLVVIKKEDGGTLYSLELHDYPGHIETKDTAVFEIVRSDSQEKQRL